MEIILHLYLLLFLFTLLLLFILFLLLIKEKNIQERLQQESAALRLKYEELQEDNSDLKVDYAALHSKHTENMKASEEKLQLLQNAKEELSREFKLLANQIFEDKSKEFSHTNSEQLYLLLKPFREQITNFSTQAKEQFGAQVRDSILLKDELLRLREMNAQLSQDALNLTKALKGENKTQGNWGEIVLENILEQSGLREGVEYELQATLKSTEGKTYRPDVIIHLPQQRDIVVDSKVSLVAYEHFVNAEDPYEKEQALKEHILSIKGHIKGLSMKQYEKLQGVNSLDFVLLFMPIEGAFLLALEQDGSFFKSAYEQNILVVSPSTLLVTLRTIEHIWRTEHQEEHAKKIADEAEAMVDKLVGFVEEMQKVGTHLHKAQESFDTSMNRLSSGRGNLIKRAENIVKLGVKPKKPLPIKSKE